MTPTRRYAAVAVLAALLLAVSIPQVTPLSAQSPPPTVPPPEGARMALPLVYQQALPEIAFSYSIPRDTYGFRVGDIGVLSANGIAEWRLTRNMLDHPNDFGYMSWGPAWSPDGRRLAFSHYEARNEDIHTVDIATGAITNLTNTSDVWENSPSWSPDGRRIAFVCGRDLCTMDAGGGNRMRLTQDGVSVPFMRGPAWSPDGSEIAYAAYRGGQSAIYLIQADGTAERRVGPDVPEMGVSGPVWSPDGQWLAIQTTMAGRAGVFRTPVDGGEWTRVSDLEASGTPAWSPNGEWLAFSSCDDVACGLWVVHPDGSGASRVAETGVNPTWSPDSQWLAYNAVSPTGFPAEDIWVVRLDGTDRRNLTDHIDPPAVHPVWRP